MVVNGANHLSEQLEGLRTAHFEKLVDERAEALVQKEAQEQDRVGTERAIVDGARQLRERIIDVQVKNLRVRQATRVGRWIMTRRSIPEIRFGFGKDDGFGWDADDMTVATAPLMAVEEETVDGKVSHGWVFQLKSPIPEAMAWSGKAPPIHAWGRYDRSSVDIFMVAEDQTTGLQTKEKWFTINPDTDHISCWKLAEGRRGFFDALEDEPSPEEDQRVRVHIDEESGQVKLGIEQINREAEEREPQRFQRLSERLREQYAPDLETGLHLLGLIRGSLIELS